MSLESNNNPEGGGWGEEKVGLPGIISIGLYFILLAGFLFYTLTVYWPPAGAEVGRAKETVLYFGSPYRITPELSLLILVVLAGAIGGFVHTIRSFSWYVGQRKLVWSWLTRYILQPVVSSALGLLFYFVIRGGFFSTSAAIDQSNPFSFVAVAGLVGMFAEPAILKLKQVAETLFTKPEPGANNSPQDAETEKDENDNNKSKTRKSNRRKVNRV